MHEKKKVLTSQVIREIQINNPESHHSTRVRLALVRETWQDEGVAQMGQLSLEKLLAGIPSNITKRANINGPKRKQVIVKVWETRTLLPCWWEQYVQKTMRTFSRKLPASIWTNHPFPGNTPKVSKIHSYSSKTSRRNSRSVTSNRLHCLMLIYATLTLTSPPLVASREK